MMYDRLKQLVLEAELPSSNSKKQSAKQSASNLPVELGGRGRGTSNLPAELGGRVPTNKQQYAVNTRRYNYDATHKPNDEMGGNPTLRARLLANLRASRAARGKSNFDTFSRSQDAIAAYKAKEAEQKKQDAQKKISGALKSSGAGALVGNAIARKTGLQGATIRKAAPGSLV